LAYLDPPTYFLPSHTHTHVHTLTEVAQEASSNEEEYKLSRVPVGEGEEGPNANPVIGMYCMATTL